MTVKTRESFKLKLCLWILGVSIAVFGLLLTSIYYYVSDEVRHDVRATADAKLDYVLRGLDEGLTGTEISAANLMSITQSPMASQELDSIYTIFKYFLEANPRVQGVALGYIDNVKGGDCGFCPYLMNMGDGTLTTMDLATVKDYRSRPWFTETLKNGKGTWSKPYRETNGTLITSYCIPICHTDGTVYGVLALDLGLDVVNNDLQSLRPYPNAQLAIIDTDHYYVAHPNKDYILNVSADSMMQNYHFVEGDDIKEFAAKGDGRGYGSIKTEEDELYVFYVPEPKTGWTILLEVPRSDIISRLTHLGNILIIIMIVGVLLLLAICLGVINRLTKPLEKFAEAAREISHGNFDVKLPVVTSHNELYDLRAALASMKGSLNTYIDKLEQTTKSKATIESELNTARRIQMAMVPKIFPPYPNRPEIDIYGSLLPAKAVGGDLYDFVLDGDDFYFCIGDVSGKGVPASLFMAITRSLFRNNVTHTKSPALVATFLNNAIAEGNDENMFVTMFIGCCNLKTGRFTCCNCGHNAPATNGQYVSADPITVGPGEVVHLMEKAPTNLPIGVFEGFEYQEVSMQLEPGAKILLYTDGITEAENPKAELYGDDRLLATLSSLPIQTSAEQTVKTLIDDVHHHADGAEQSDDITVLCIHYRPKG